MRPLSNPAFRPATPAVSEEELDATVSFSSSDDEKPDPPAAQTLARALLAFDPALVPTYVALGIAEDKLAPLAEYLVRLDTATAAQTAVRAGIVAWLRALAANEAARDRVLTFLSALNGGGSTLGIYRMLRAATH